MVVAKSKPPCLMTTGIAEYDMISELFLSQERAR